MSTITITNGEKISTFNFETKKNYYKSKENMLNSLRLQKHLIIEDTESKSERLIVFPIQYLQNSIIEFKE